MDGRPRGLGPRPDGRPGARRQPGRRDLHARVLLGNAGRPLRLLHASAAGGRRRGPPRRRHGLRGRAPGPRGPRRGPREIARLHLPVALRDGALGEGRDRDVRVAPRVRGGAAVREGGRAAPRDVLSREGAAGARPRGQLRSSRRPRRRRSAKGSRSTSGGCWPRPRPAGKHASRSSRSRTSGTPSASSSWRRSSRA